MKFIALLAFCLLPFTAQASQFNCAVARKTDSKAEYTTGLIAAEQPSILLTVDDNEDENPLNDKASISSCQVTAADGKTCDTYEVDKIAYDEATKLKKYYNYYAQVDLQVWPDMSFMLNDGRSGVSYGSCKVSKE